MSSGNEIHSRNPERHEALVHRYDSIIIGAGHNGLVCANYLARSGQKVLVLESSENVGGLASTREFYPGFRTAIAHTVSHFSLKVSRELELESHGFKPGDAPLATIGLSKDHHHVVIAGDELKGVHQKDLYAYRDYAAFMQRFSDLLNPFWLKTVPRVGNNSLPEILSFASLGLNLRLLGKDAMREFLRIITLPMRDLMDENFDNDILKAMLSWDGLVGSRLAPRSPNHAVFALLYRMCGNLHQSTTGVHGLVTALHSSATASGVEIRTGTPVQRILVGEHEQRLAATGVELLDSEIIEASKIISSADPKSTFLDLVGVEHLEIGFTNRIRRLRSDGFVAKLHLALDELPAFTGLKNPDGRMIIAPNLDAIEFAFDDSKYGQCSEKPVMEVVIPTLQDSSLAPTDQHVLSAQVMYVPYQLKGGWNEQAREQFCERAIDTLEQYAPGIRKHILHQELLTPFDLEQTYGNTGGHWHHTEFSLDQLFMMRPTYEAAQYSTPIKGLHLCGAGCHPGGGLMGGPGHNAAREILR
jgi:phytoene dehydrogenase-like protein